MTDLNRAVAMRLLNEAERVVLSDAGSGYTRLREAVNEVRQSIGLGPLTDAVTEYPIHISRREAMELSIETRRKVMARMTDAFMDAMAAEQATVIRGQDERIIQQQSEIARLRGALEHIENLGAESDGKTDLTVKMFYAAHNALSTD